MNSASLTNHIERAVDSEGELSLREFLTRVYVRPRLFWTCVLLPPVLAMILTAFVPPEWQATAKILIRYSSSESPFLQGLIPGDRPALSGASSAEILKSIPTLAAAIQQHDIQPADIYRKPGDVLGGYISRIGGMFFSPDTGPSLPGIDPKTLATATAFKNSLDGGSAFGASSHVSGGVEVLDKYSQLPETMKGDELIEVTVPSFNRLKVAEMTNGLAEAFIDEYYKVSAEDAHRAYEFLSTLIANAEADLAAGTAEGADAGHAADATRVGGGGDQIYRQSPLLESMARELANRKDQLAHLRQIYNEDSPEVTQARRQVEGFEQSLGGTQRVEVGKQMLEELKARRYQAYNTERLYRNRLMPISVIEPALTPPKSLSKQVRRYVMAGVVGLVLGLVLGVALIVILSTLDQRLFTSWDVQRALQLPLLGWLPEVQPSLRGGEVEHGLESGLMQILGRLDAANPGAGGTVVVVTSASRGEGKSFVAQRLVAAIGGRSRVLLVDGDPRNRSLSRHFDMEGKPGLLDAIVELRALADFAVKTRIAGVDLIPAGDATKRAELGFYRRTLKSLLDGARDTYDLVVVDTPSLLTGNEALMCSMAVDGVLLVAESGTTRRPMIRQACQKLQEVGVVPRGVILNRRKNLLPGWIYRNV